jgi:hypothetical protein
MTEAEAVESATAFWNLFATMLTLYLSATSGYLVVAYLIGGKLNRAQVFTISCLYVLFAFLSAYASIGFGLRGIDYVSEMMKHRPDAIFYGRPEAVIAVAMILFAGIFACLKFMWDVRHPKSE